ncbi:MAG: tetratricopeptide repeat protein [Anaerolineae bacterium]
MENLTLTDFDALWDFNQPAATEQKFRELLPAAQSSGDASYHAQLLTQIARTEGLQRKFEDAHRTLDTVQTILTDDLKLARVRYLLERGRVFNSSGKADTARPLFAQALESAQQITEDNYAVDAAHMLAIIAPSEEAIEWNQKAIAMAEASQQPRARKWLASLYNNLGWAYHDTKKYDTALDMFQKALVEREKAGDPVTTRIARWAVARTLRSLGRTGEALDIQQTLLLEHGRAGTHDGFVYEEIAECLLAMGKTQESRRYFAQAHEQLSKDPWFVANEATRLERLKQLSIEA